MAVFMNAKGTSNTEFMFGKRGGKIFGGTSTPSGAAVGDLWFDKSNSALKLAGGSEGSITWSNLIVQGGSISAADLEVSGNLIVSGTTTTLNTQTLNVEDNIIVLNSNFSGADNIVDAGIEVERGDETNVTFLWDESEGEWTLGDEVLNAGAFIGNLTGDVTGNVQPNGGPNSVTANTLTASATLNVTGATITGLSTSSVSEGSNKYYTDERVDDRVNALIQGGNGITSTYDDSAGTLTISRDADLDVSDFVDAAYMTTGETWADDDSTFATTAAIADRIDAQIAASDSAVHITGNETITGDKTISGATLTLTANSTLDVSNATVTGANSDSISEGSTNLYYTNPRVRQALQVIDDSDQLSYSNGTGIFTFTNNRLALSGGTMSGNIDMGNSSVLGVDTLRINENGAGLRMTNVGAFDNSGGDFRIFSTNDLILSTNGENGTAVTFDQTTKEATFTGAITTTGNITGGTLRADNFTTQNAFVIVGSDNNLIQDTTLSVDPASNFLGINQTSPEVTLHMTGEGDQTAQIRMEQYNNSADAPDVRTRRYRGTIASPSAVQSGDYLYRSNHEYWNGSALIVGGQFAFDNTNNANRTQFTVAVTTDGTSVEASSNDDVQLKIDGNDGGAITFNNAYKFPTSDGTAGQFLQTDGSGGLTFSSEFTDLSITGTATYNTVEFQNSNIMKFNQMYTGASTGSYFTNGEYQKVVTIIPDGAAQNYQVVGRITAQNANETHTVYFNAALRSNTLPNLDWTITYDEEYNGGRYIDPQLWTKQTTTAGFIFAFKTLSTIYGTVTVDMEIIPRSSSQKDNVTVNSVQNSEQSSVEAGYTANDMVLVTRKQGTTLSVKDVSITGNIVPTANVTYDLGTDSSRFKDLYLSGSTINLGTTKISVTSDNEIDFSDSANTSVKRKLVVDEIEIGSGDDKVVLRKGSDGKLKSVSKNRSTKAETSNKVDLDDNDTDDLSEGSTNLYYTDARVNTVLASKDSDDTKEGSTNLYYTDARANSAIDAKLTGDITLGNVTSQSVNTGVVEGVVFQPITDYGSITSTANITIDYGAVNEAGTVPAIGDFEYISDIFGPTGDSYKVDGLPSAAQPGQMIYVSDETGGSVMAFSDGSNWRRITDRAVVS
jgi:hypothetical protein